MLARVKRRLSDAWDCWPWIIGLMYDPRCLLEERRRIAAEFGHKSRCCLDTYFSVRALDLLGDGVDDVLEDAVSRAMIAILNSC